ncbi:glycosyl hydrolase catalytic core-domain-containing protein [Lactifluus subvellereus]|nr:glycosyl hydrolase catalytic core-domain-containing protein [Lactifluus subvellereus]
MPSIKLLFTVLSLAILNVSFNSLPTYALAVERDHIARGFNHAHVGIAKKKRTGSSKRCKSRLTGLPVVSPAAAVPSSSSTTTYTPSPTPAAASPKPQADKATTTSSPVPVTTPAPSSSGNHKVGLAWSNGEQSALSKFQSPHTRYIYNWQLDGYGGNIDPSKYGFEYIPMVHDSSSAPRAREVVTSTGAKILLTMNEPDQSSQSNMSPSEAVKLWLQYIDSLSQDGVRLISPACTNSPDGFKWMVEFMNACNGCHISAIATHYYGTDPGDFENHVNKLHDTFSRNIWVTEFACQDFSGQNHQCDNGQVWNFLTQTQNFLEGAAFVEAYFWFAPMTQSEIQVQNVNRLDSLMKDNGSPSDLGYKYLNP